MTDGGNGADAPGAGGPVRHVPVMLDEVLAHLVPASGETIVDGTFGAGGYTRAILDSGANVLAIDQDPNAIRDGEALVREAGGRLVLAHGRFSALDKIARESGHASVDGVVLDIGVSSMQLDEAERGFSFQKDGPLDMRMGQSGLSAADVVNRADHSTLTRVFGILGEEKQASKVSRAVIAAREATAFSTTLQLADVIRKAIGRVPKDKIHPATRSFQGLRIFINRELEELAEGLFAAERILKPGGRLVVVTFHSLEDRIVKKFFADRTGSEGGGGSRHLPQMEMVAATFEQKKRGAVPAGASEIADNPRARSAKLRSGTRTDEPARESDMGLFGLPNLSPDKLTSSHSKQRKH